MATQAEQNSHEKDFTAQLQTSSGTAQNARNKSNVCQSRSHGYYSNANGIGTVTIDNQGFVDDFGNRGINEIPDSWIIECMNSRDDLDTDDSNMRYGSVNSDTNSDRNVPRHVPIHNSIGTTSSYVTSSDTAPLVYNEEDFQYGAPTTALGPENRLQEFPPRTAKVNPFRVSSPETPATLDLEHGDNANWSVEPYHCHKPLPEMNRSARNKLITVSVLCTIFMIAEIIGKYYWNYLCTY